MQIRDVTAATVTTAIASLTKLESILEQDLAIKCKKARERLVEFSSEIPSIAKRASVLPLTCSAKIEEAIEFLESVTALPAKQNRVIADLRQHRQVYSQVLVSRSDEIRGLRSIVEPTQVFVNELKQKSEKASGHADALNELLATVGAWGSLEPPDDNILAAARQNWEDYRDIQDALDDLGDSLESSEHRRVFDAILRGLRINRLGSQVRRFTQSASKLKAVNKELGEELENIQKFERGVARCAKIVDIIGKVFIFLGAL